MDIDPGLARTGGRLQQTCDSRQEKGEKIVFAKSFVKYLYSGAVGRLGREEGSGSIGENGVEKVQENQNLHLILPLQLCGRWQELGQRQGQGKVRRISKKFTSFLNKAYWN